MIKLKGITGHGKNRIREHGELWEVLELPPGVVSMSKNLLFPLSSQLRLVREMVR